MIAQPVEVENIIERMEYRASIVAGKLHVMIDGLGGKIFPPTEKFAHLFVRVREVANIADDTEFEDAFCAMLK